MNSTYRLINSILPIAIILAVLTSGCGNSISTPNGQPSPVSDIPQNADRLVKRAAQKFDNKDYRGAYEDANQALKIHSNLGDAHFIRGASRFALGEQQEGIDDVQTAAQIYNNKGRMDVRFVVTESVA